MRVVEITAKWVSTMRHVEKPLFTINPNAPVIDLDVIENSKTIIVRVL